VGIAQIALASALLVAGIQTAVAQAATGQDPAQEQSSKASASKWEFLVASGILFPTGAERDVVRRANVTAMQLSYVVRPELAVTGAVGWARSRDISSDTDPKLDIFTYDLGAEFRPAGLRAGHAVKFSPFVGAGVGGRNYHYHDLDLAATHSLAGYVAAGGEFGVRRVRLRIEVRDYLSGFKPLRGNGSGSTSNDVVAMVGLRIVGG
jgi:hypothetical protein